MNMIMKVLRCAFWRRCSGWMSMASAQSASAWCYWLRTAPMLDWLVFMFRIDFATTRNPHSDTDLKCGDWNVKLHPSVHCVLFRKMNHTLTI